MNGPVAWRFDDIVPWLREQFAEDERGARLAEERMDELLAWLWPSIPEADQHIARHNPARVLAEVAAKRKLLDYLVTLEDKASTNNWWVLDTLQPLLLLALPYADRPGYRPEWSPDT